MPDDPKRDYVATGHWTRQLVALATDVLVARLERCAAGRYAADELIREGILPACYRARYDADFLERWTAEMAVARDLLVSDAPLLPTALSALAARSILARAADIVEKRGEGCHPEALAVDPRLPEQLESNAPLLLAGLRALEHDALSGDVCALFALDGHLDPVAAPAAPARGEQIEALGFENWARPSGGAPRSHLTWPNISYDGRAWPLEP